MKKRTRYIILWLSPALPSLETSLLSKLAGEVKFYEGHVVAQVINNLPTYL